MGTFVFFVLERGFRMVNVNFLGGFVGGDCFSNFSITYHQEFIHKKLLSPSFAPLKLFAHAAMQPFKISNSKNFATAATPTNALTTPPFNALSLAPLKLLRT